MNHSASVFAVIAIVILFCLAAGCTGTAAKKSAGSGSLPVSSRGGDSGGGSGGGAGNSGDFPKQTYLAVDCAGAWKDTTIHGEAPWNHHGNFHVTGNVPFSIEYDYNLMGFGLYPDVNAGRSDRSNPLRIRGESWECVGAAGDCQQCHYVFDGEIYAGGTLIYNRSADSSRRWTATLTRMPGGEGIWHTISATQTEGACPTTDLGEFVPTEITLPADACFTANRGTESGNGFSFSDGSAFDVDPRLDPDNTEFSTLTPHVTFHMGRAPS